MSKILALSNIELKKNFKFYSIYCATIFVSIVAINSLFIFRAAGMYETIELYRNKIGGAVYGAMILESNIFVKFVLTVGIMGALLYTVAIWLGDWKGSHRNIYTYLMIPGSRMKLYAAKVLNSVFFAYMVMVCEIIGLFASKMIFNMVFSSKIDIIDTSLNADLSFVSDTLFVNSNIIDFLIENVLYVFTIISIISMLMIIIMSLKNKTLGFVVLGILIFITSVFGININTASSKVYQLFLNAGITDNMIVAKIIIAVVITIICTLVSSYLSNRKMSV